MRGRIGQRGGTCGPRIYRRLQEIGILLMNTPIEILRYTPSTNASSFTEIFETLGAELAWPCHRTGSQNRVAQCQNVILPVDSKAHLCICNGNASVYIANFIYALYYITKALIVRMHCFAICALVDIRQAKSRLLKKLFICRLFLLGMLGSFLLRGVQLLAYGHVTWRQLLGRLKALHRLLIIFEP